LIIQVVGLILDELGFMVRLRLAYDISYSWIMISWISFHDIIYHHYPWMVGLVEVYEEITIHSLGFYHQPLGSDIFLVDPWRMRVAIRPKVSH